MSMIDELSLGTSLDLAGFRRDFGSATKLVDDWVASSAKRMEGMKLPGPSVAAAGGGGAPAGSDLGSMASDLGTAIAPLAGQIQAALAPLNGFAARFSAQFDAVGGTFQVLARRIDQALKLPKFNELLDQVRYKSRSASGGMAADFLKAFGLMGGEVKRFGGLADSVLGGIKFGVNARAWVKSLGDVGNRGLKEFSKIKAPILNFDNSIRNITTLRGATEAATQSFKSMGGQVALSLGAFGLTYKAVGFLKEGIGTAAHLNETIAKTNAILGDASPAVKAFAGELSSQFGIVRGQVLDAASSFGGLGKGLGDLSGKELSDFTNRFTKAAGDLKAFADLGSFDEARQALTIGLSGEQSDVLKRLGIVTIEAAMNQYALANGIRKTAGAFTEQQKLAIRSGLIMEKFAKLNITGTLEREADGSVSRWDKLSGTITNLGTTIGASLLPVVDRLVAGFTGLATSAAGAFERSKPAIDGFSASLLHGFDAIGTAVTALSPVVLGIGSTIAGAFSVGGSSALSFLPTFGQVVDGIKAGLETVHEGIKATIGFFRGIPGWIDSAFGSGTASAIAGFAGQVATIAPIAALAAGGIALAGSAIGSALGLLSSGPVIIGAVGAGLAYLTGNTFSLGEVMSDIGFAARNAGELLQVAFITGGAYVDQFLGNLALIPENLGRIADFAANNWLDWMLSPFETLGMTVFELAKSIGDFFRDPTGGFSFDFDEAFKPAMDMFAKLPEMAKASFAEIGPEVDRIFEQIGRKESDFAKRLGPAFVMPEMPKVAIPAMNAIPKAIGASADKATATGGKDVKFAGAYQAGSTEAYSAIVKARGNGGPMDAIAKAGRDQVAEHKKGNALLGDIHGALKAIQPNQAPKVIQNF